MRRITRFAMIAFFVASGAARAGQRTLVVDQLRVAGTLDDAARAFFLAGIQDGIESTGSGLVAPNTLLAALKERPELALCDDDRCLLSLARATQAQAVVIGQVTKDVVRGERERARYQVRLRLYDAEVADFTSVEEESCTRCSEPELQALLRAVAKRLLERERHPETAPLEVVSVPSEAEVRVDGRLLGLSDLSQSIAVGAHHLTVERRGLVAGNVEVTLVAGRKWRVTVRWPDPSGAAQIEQGAPPVPGVAVAPPPALPPPLPPPSLPSWYRRADGVAGVALLVATAGGLASGLALILINGDPAGCDVTHAGQHCPNRYATVGGGVALLVVAAVTGTVGSALVDGRVLRKRVTASALVGPNLLGATLLGRF